jgi:hypothetical protein
MASYLTPPNLQAQQTTPVKSLNQQVMSTIGARTQYYVSTLTNMKNQRDSAVSMNLTDETNKQELQSLTEQADKQIADMTKKDLSIGNYAAQTKDLLKPITQNQNFLYDEHITGLVSGELQKAQGIAAEKGPSSYHLESVKALQNTLGDLRTARKDAGDNPNWAKRFLNDTLGTTYVPYDSKIDEKFDAESRKFLKDLKSKYTTNTAKYDAQGNPTGFYLSESEVSAVTDMEMQNWLKSNRPEQQVYRNQLKGKNDLHDIRTLLKADPVRGQEIALSHLNNAKEQARVSDINVVNRTINNLANAALAVASTDSPKYHELKAQIEGLQGKDGKGGYKKDLQDHYDKMDVTKFISDPTTGYKDLGDLYDRTQVNATVGAMGLDRVSTELKSDASATNMQMNREKLAVQKQIAAMNAQAKIDAAAAKAKTTLNADGSTANTNITPSVEIGSTPEDGNAIVDQVHHELERNELDVKKDFLAQQGAVVNVNGESVNILEFLKDKDEPLEKLLNDSDLSGQTKELLKALNGAAYAAGNNLDKTTRNVSGRQAAERILFALTNKNTLSDTLKRAAYNSNAVDLVAGFGFQLENFNNKRTALAGQFVKPTREAAEAAGLQFNDKNNIDIVNLDENAYSKDVTQHLRQFGATPEDAGKIAEYLRTGKEAALLGNPKYVVREVRNEGHGQTSTIYQKSNLFNQLDTYKKTWDKFKENRARKYLESGHVPLANAATFNVVSTSMDSKTFDPNSMVYESSVPNLLSRATTMEGTQQNSAAYKGFEAIKGKLGDSGNLMNMRIVDDGSGRPYVKLTLKTGAGKKLLEDASTEDLDNVKDFVQNASKLKIYVPQEEISKFGFGKQSKAVLDYKNNGGYKYKLPSGGNIQFINRGQGQLDVEPDGEFEKVVLYTDGTLGIEKVKLNRNTVNTVLNPQGRPDIDPQASLQQVPEKVGQGIYTLDLRASTLKNILQSNNIDASGKVKISDLQKLKEKDFINNIISLSK